MSRCEYRQTLSSLLNVLTACYSAMVSVPFHQIARSTCPIATLGIYRWVYGRTYSKATYLSLIPVVLGVGLSTYGDYYFTLMGFTLTFLGVFLASVKVFITAICIHFGIED